MLPPNGIFQHFSLYETEILLQVWDDIRVPEVTTLFNYIRSQADGRQPW